MKTKKAFLGLSTLLLVSPAVPQTLPLGPGQSAPLSVDYGEVEKDLTDFIQKKMDKLKVKGLSIALVDGTGVVWVKGFGFADIAQGTPATGDTLYPLGSPTKLFTAGEILKLEGEGKVRLDEPIQNDIPGFSIQSRFKRAKPITLGALLANHSGLPGFFIKGAMAKEPQSLGDFVTGLKSDYLTAPPQTLYKYSFVDYDLLGRVIELKRKMNFEEAMEKDWLRPLGMDASSFRWTPGLEAKLAKGYLHGNPTPLFHLRDVPAAGLVTNVNDMARFLCFVLGTGLPESDPPLNRRAVDLMFEPQYPSNPLNFGHEVGMGWMLSGLNVEGSEGTAWHDGVYPPYVSEMAVLNRQKLGVVLLANSEDAIKISDDITIRALKLMLNAKYGLKLDLEKKKKPMPKTVEVPGEKLDHDTGFYSAAGQLTSVTRRGDHLSTELLHTGLDLMPISQDTFVPRFTLFFLFPIDFPENTMTFSTVEGHDVTVFNGFNYPIVLEKIAPVPLPDSWRRRMGDYLLENPDDWINFEKVSLTEKEGFLTIVMKVSFPAFGIKDRDYKVALKPLSDEDAVDPGLFYGDGGTLHAVEEGGVARIYYSGYWFRKQ
jgi:CubicO group peptidase (beta-lactamase class C family)